MDNPATTYDPPSLVPANRIQQNDIMDIGGHFEIVEAASHVPGTTSVWFVNRVQFQVFKPDQPVAIWRNLA
jgi:hypothetical protein